MEDAGPLETNDHHFYLVYEGTSGRTAPNRGPHRQAQKRNTSKVRTVPVESTVQLLSAKVCYVIGVAIASDVEMVDLGREIW